ncbi:hypothetical protein PITC_070410 [Penicillium italicum]|uniref:Uncharacterized protein n=1 Tax=Penicillium italicum TaxID=40296 RepID=A0A0A2KNF2_PENIT|nr:hypothetical protein PITC_070410 [Penicillium italicum]
MFWCGCSNQLLYLIGLSMGFSSTSQSGPRSSKVWAWEWYNLCLYLQYSIRYSTTTVSPAV